jgi:flavorubredoxin
VFVPEINLQFNHFLVKDQEPVLFHTGLRGMFPEVRDAVSTIIGLGDLRHISFSHFESDECGALNQWLDRAPKAEPVCGLVGALVSVNDFSNKPATYMAPRETFSTGRYRFRFIPTPHVPHGWDAGVLFEETGRTLLCSDLFHQWGDREPLTHASIIDRAHETLMQMESGPFANYVPYTHRTGQILEGLAQLQPTTLATMHGSSYVGDGSRALRELSVVMQEVLGPRVAWQHSRDAAAVWLRKAARR